MAGVSRGGRVVVPGTSFAKGVKILLPPRPALVEAKEKEEQGGMEGGWEGNGLLTGMLVPASYGVSLSQSTNGGRR